MTDELPDVEVTMATLDGVPLLYHLASQNKSVAIPNDKGYVLVQEQSFHFRDANTGHLMEFHYEGDDLHVKDLDTGTVQVLNNSTVSVSLGLLDGTNDEAVILVGNNHKWE